MPRQQLLDPVDGVVCDTGEHLSQIRLRVQAIELGGADETVERGGPLASRIGACEEKIFTPESYRSEGAFGSVIVDLDAPVLAVLGERLPARERVADGASEFGLLGGLAHGGSEPGVQIGKQG